MPRIVLVPRWSGDESSDWYPWLRRSHPLEVSPLLPTKDAPEIEPSVAALAERITSDTVLIGHSVGCQVVMRALARRDDVLPAAILVAAWWTVDAPWDSIRPWIEAPFDTDRAKRAAKRIEVLLSDDDPFTADYASTQRLFEERLGARVTVHEGARHFNEAEAPAVLKALT